VTLKIAIATLCLLSYCCPAIALCPRGYQQTEGYRSKEVRLRWSGSGDYSTCLSLDYPEKNNARGSYAIGDGNSRYKCGNIILGNDNLNMNYLSVQPTDPSLSLVRFQLDLPQPLGSRTRKWCESGNPVTCYDEYVLPQTFFSRYTSRMIEAERISRRVTVCKLVAF